MGKCNTPQGAPEYIMLKEANLECMSEQTSALPPVPPMSLPLNVQSPPMSLPLNVQSLPVVVTREKDGQVIKGSGVTVYGQFFAFDAQEIDLIQERRNWSGRDGGLRMLLESFSRGQFAKLQTLYLVIAR